MRKYFGGLLGAVAAGSIAVILWLLNFFVFHIPEGNGRLIFVLSTVLLAVALVWWGNTVPKPTPVVQPVPIPTPPADGSI